MLVLQHCKEEQISDDEFLASSDEVNNEKTWYPSDCVLEECNESKEKRNESKEASKKGHCKPQLMSAYQ